FGPAPWRSGLDPRSSPGDSQRRAAFRRIEHVIAQFGDGIHGDRRHFAAALAAGAMCHSRHACIGMTFPGFDRRSGSNTSRNAHIVASESAEKIMSMYGSLSRPTPCSPVIVPPAFTHAAMISRIAA